MSAAFLSDEWLERYAAAGADLPALEGVDAVVQYVVSGSPDGKVTWYEVVADGRTTEAGAGKRADAEVTITWSYDEAVALLRGEVDADVSFMRGDTKVDGEYQVWVDTLDRRRRSAEWIDALHTLAAETDT